MTKGREYRPVIFGLDQKSGHRTASECLRCEQIYEFRFFRGPFGGRTEPLRQILLPVPIVKGAVYKCRASEIPSILSTERADVTCTALLCHNIPRRAESVLN